MRLPLQARLVVPALFGVAAITTGTHAAAIIGHAAGHPSVHAWLVAAYDILRTGVSAAFALFTVGRAAPRHPARSPVAFVACGVAMAAVVAFGDPPPHTPGTLVVAGELVAVASCTWLMVAVAFLGRCFGVLPEARGLVTRGPYGVVRHPVYLGEIGACVGLAIAAPTLPNAIALGALGAAQGVRMRLEERALQAAFPEYEHYARQVPRLVPVPRHLVSLRARPGAETLSHGDVLELREPAG